VYLVRTVQPVCIPMNKRLILGFSLPNNVVADYLSGPSRAIDQVCASVTEQSLLNQTTFDLDIWHPAFNRPSLKAKVIGQSSRPPAENIVKVVGVTSSEGFSSYY